MDEESRDPLSTPDDRQPDDTAPEPWDDGAGDTDEAQGPAVSSSESTSPEAEAEAEDSAEATNSSGSSVSSTPSDETETDPDAAGSPGAGSDPPEAAADLATTNSTRETGSTTPHQAREASRPDDGATTAGDSDQQIPEADEEPQNAPSSANSLLSERTSTLRPRRAPQPDDDSAPSGSGATSRGDETTDEQPPENSRYSDAPEEPSRRANSAPRTPEPHQAAAPHSSDDAVPADAKLSETSGTAQPPGPERAPDSADAGSPTDAPGAHPQPAPARREIPDSSTARLRSSTSRRPTRNAPTTPRPPGSAPPPATPTAARADDAPADAQAPSAPTPTDATGTAPRTADRATARFGAVPDPTNGAEAAPAPDASSPSARADPSAPSDAATEATPANAPNSLPATPSSVPDASPTPGQAPRSPTPSAPPHTHPAPPPPPWAPPGGTAGGYPPASTPAPPATPYSVPQAVPQTVTPHAVGPVDPYAVAPHADALGWELPPSRPPSWWRRRKRTLQALGVVVLLALCGLMILAMVRQQTGTTGLLVGFGLALFPLPLLLAAFRWLDAVEWTPWRNHLFAFAWGACAATLVALVTNGFATDWLANTVVVNSPREADTLGATVVAPVVEELVKAVAVLLLFLFRRRHFTGVVSGIAAAGITAAGFAFTENILYLGTAYDTDTTLGPDPVQGSATLATFFIRIVLAPFAHPLFTALTGVGIGLIAVLPRRRRLLRVLSPVFGVVTAILLHAIWNGSASFTDVTFLVVYGAFMVPVAAALTWLAIWSRQNDLSLVRDTLVDYAEAGWFAPPEPWALGTMRARSAARSAVRHRYGKEAAQEVTAYQRAATSLALLRARAEQGTSCDDFAAREQALFTELDAHRTLGAPATVRAALSLAGTVPYPPYGAQPNPAPAHAGWAQPPGGAPLGQPVAPGTGVPPPQPGVPAPQPAPYRPPGAPGPWS